MSVTLFVQCCKNGERATFPRQIAWKIFEPFATPAPHGENRLWNLRLPDGGQGELLIEEDEEIDGFSIGRYGGYALFEAVFAVMKQTSTFFYTTEWPQLMVADAAVIAEMDPEPFEVTGIPIVVGSGLEMADINENGGPFTY